MPIRSKLGGAVHVPIRAELGGAVHVPIRSELGGAVHVPIRSQNPRPSPIENAPRQTGGHG